MLRPRKRPECAPHLHQPRLEPYALTRRSLVVFCARQTAAAQAACGACVLACPRLADIAQVLGPPVALLLCIFSFPCCLQRIDRPLVHLDNCETAAADADETHQVWDFLMALPCSERLVYRRQVSLETAGGNKEAPDNEIC